jgi:integrase/recombinase XerD
MKTIEGIIAQIELFQAIMRASFLTLLKEKTGMSHNQPAITLKKALDQFLLDLKNANKSAYTIRAYHSDLRAFSQGCPDLLMDVTTQHLRDFFARQSHLKPATRARRQTSLASFFDWAYRHELVPKNPMQRLDRVRVEYTLQRIPNRKQIEAIFQCIPQDKLRDRLLFRLLFETGIRIGEALSLYIEDLDFTPDDEQMTITGKGQHRRTILLDDPRLVVLMKTYIHQQGYQHGPLFRAHKNYQGGAIRYQSARELWAKYCQQAGVTCTLHQLRHAHATELVNDGVSLATIRKRLGHKNFQTTLRYAHQSDNAANAEIRAWRRKQQHNM